jgi:hypothetical protein
MCDFLGRPQTHAGRYAARHAQAWTRSGFSPWLAERHGGNGEAMEEPRGSRKDRLARLAGRGREETTPVAVHLGVVGAVALLVGVILVISMVLWAVLR